jgi:hypothetical protein
MKIGRLGSSALLAFFEEVRGIDVFELDFQEALRSAAVKREHYAP